MAPKYHGILLCCAVLTTLEQYFNLTVSNLGWHKLCIHCAVSIAILCSECLNKHLSERVIVLL